MNEANGVRSCGGRMTTLMLILAAGCSPALDPFPPDCRGGLDPDTDYLEVVQAYADAMIEEGRDRYGDQHSPLFAVTLDRQTTRLPEGLRRRAIGRLGFEEWGVRPQDRIMEGGNPMRHQNLYQTLYALTAATGDARYAEKADEGLAWFFRSCQSEGTHLLAWGDHAGWDFYDNVPAGTDIHEFSRPWVLWERVFELTPEPAIRFARGLWDHQIGDQKTGAFSRHARLSRHGPGTGWDFPRHAGFYIDIWTEAYRRTHDETFLRAIQTLVDFYARHASKKTGAIPAEVDNPRSNNVMLWPQSNLSLAIDLWRSTEGGDLPEQLTHPMRQMALGIDEVYKRLPHKVHEGGGLVQRSHIDTLEAISVIPGYSDPYTDRWGGAYGHRATVKVANKLVLRYQQTNDEGLRRLILDAAAQYLDSEPDADAVIYPGTLADTVFLMLAVHEMTGERRFLDRADHFGTLAVQMFFDEGSPLPRATSQHDHYEANINRPDTLVMALLKLWEALEEPETVLPLVWNDR